MERQIDNAAWISLASQRASIRTREFTVGNLTGRHPMKILPQEKSSEIHVLPHKIFRARCLTRYQRLGNSVMIIVRPCDHAVVVPQDYAIRDEGDAVRLRDQSGNPRIAGQSKNRVVEGDVHQLIRLEVVGEQATPSEDLIPLGQAGSQLSPELLWYATLCRQFACQALQ